MGVQLIGPMFEDRTQLRLAELLEQRIGGFQPPSWARYPGPHLVAPLPPPAGVSAGR
ncbi:MAG TPA: hypothetical protein VGN37_20795 [Actinocatenispora sp.]